MAQSLSKIEREILTDVLSRYRQSGRFPERRRFRLDHEQNRGVIDDLTRRGLLTERGDSYGLTLEGLLACKDDHAGRIIELCDALLPVLKDCYRQDPDKFWDISELSSHKGADGDRVREIADQLGGLASKTGGPITEISKALSFLLDRGIIQSHKPSPQAGVQSVQLNESVLDAEPVAEFATKSPAISSAADLSSAERIKRLEISGYRVFSDFCADFGDLTVMVGANGSGKSSLFDFLRFLTFAVSAPLPAEIDPQGIGRVLFHSGHPERITFAVHVDLGQPKPLRYEAQIQGPKGTPRVSYERLSTTEPGGPAKKSPFVFLDFRDGAGVVRDQLQRVFVRPRWTLEPNELALRRAVDPSLVTLPRFQRFVSSWSFYSGFEMGTGSAIRRPAPTEPKPILSPNGANLSAMLFSLMAESHEAWSELETHVQSVVPGFLSLNVVPRGEPGSVIGEWIERSTTGAPIKLTLADLSDGTLRFLCWAVICLSPAIPPLVCVDEPELGVHPRVLPVLAGLFRLASQRSQIIIATHSPYFLSQFPLDEIAIMRKEDGHAVFRRPATSTALRMEIEELGAEALVQLHLSDELEVRS